MDKSVRALRHGRIYGQFQKSNYSNVVGLCYNHLAEDIYDFEIRAKLIQALCKIDQHKKAEKELQIFDHSYKGMVWKIVGLGVLGKVDEANYLFKECIKLKPNDPQSYKNYAGCLYDSYRYDEAIPLFKKAIELEEFSSAIGLRNDLALCYRETGDFKEAIRLLEINIEEDNRNYLSYTNKALILVDIENYDEAERICLMVIDQDNDNDHAKYVLDKISLYRSNK
ncbi:MAG: tetratricopeptide repeat protein [Bacteroidales bacterium]